MIQENKYLNKVVTQKQGQQNSNFVKKILSKLKEKKFSPSEVRVSDSYEPAVFRDEIQSKLNRENRSVLSRR